MPTASDLRFVDVTKTYGRHPVLRHVDLDVPAGSYIALMGANGAGKTTLLRLASGLATPTSGAVTLAGVDLRRAGPGLRLMLGFVSHDSLLYAELTGRQNLEFHSRMFGLADAAARIDQLADEFDLRRVLDRPAGVLSRGNRQRLTLARAMLHDPDVLLLDEPFTGLDEASSQRLVDVLGRLNAEGRTVIMTVHEMARAEAGPTRLVVIGDGGVAVDEPLAGATSTTILAPSLAAEPVLVGGSGAPHDLASRGVAAYLGEPTYDVADSVVDDMSQDEPVRPPASRGVVRRDVSLPGRLRSAWQIAAKDLAVEVKSRDALGSAALFAITVLITASFTAIPGSGQSIGTGILWISLLFAVLLGVGRSMARESQDRAIEGLLLSPAPRESIFLGKLISGLAMMTVIEAFVVPMFLVLATGETAAALDVPALVLTVFLATFGLVVVATLFSGIAVGSRMGESLLPLIVMPVVVPLMIAAVETTRRALGGDTGGAVDMTQWFALLVGFDVVVGLAAVATFSFVVEDQ
jgi:heme exporter protein A